MVLLWAETEGNTQAWPDDHKTITHTDTQNQNSRCVDKSAQANQTGQYQISICLNAYQQKQLQI